MPRSNHENHEMLRSGCAECEAILDIEMQAHRPAPNSLSYPEAEEGMAMRRRLPENQ